MLQKLLINHSAHSSNVDRLTSIFLHQLFHLGSSRGMLTNHGNLPLFPNIWRYLMQAYGVYLSPYLSENLFPDATAIDFALISGFNYSMAMLVAPFATILALRYGIKAPMIIGVALLFAAHLSSSFSTCIWQLYLSQGILLGFGVGFTYIPSIAILSQWFQQRRSLANGISGQDQGLEVCSSPLPLNRP